MFYCHRKKHVFCFLEFCLQTSLYPGSIHLYRQSQWRIWWYWNDAMTVIAHRKLLDAGNL